LARNGNRAARIDGPRQLLGWGAFTGLLIGLPVAALMGFQGMLVLRGRSELLAWVLFVVYAAGAGAVIGLVVAPRTRGLAVAACSGVVIGLLGWLFFWLTVDPVLHGLSPTWSVYAASAAYRNLVADLLHGGLVAVFLHELLLRRVNRSRSEPESPPVG